MSRGTRFKTLKLSTRILLLGIGSVFFTVVALTAAIALQSSQFNALAQVQVDQLIDADLTHIVEGVYNMVKTQDEAVQAQIDASLNTARLILNVAGAVTQAQDRVEWMAVNQLTQESSSIELPKLLIGGAWLGKNTDPAVTTPVVDQVQDLAGSTTIFQRMNERGDMLRVASAVKATDGRRAIGTYVPAVNPDGTPDPVVAAILRGEAYHGSAYVVNAWYNAAYEPLRDETGQVIGMLGVGAKQANVDTVRQAILQTKVGKDGYVYVIGSQGDELGRYIVSEKGQRDGENIWNTQDAEGRYVIQTVVNTALTLGPGQTARVRYLWQNLGDAAPRWKIAQLAYYEPWHWVIGANAMEDDFNDYRLALQAGQASLINVAGGVGVIVALLAGLIAVWLARSIARPIGDLANVAANIAGGDLTLSATVARQDEIGTLAHAFNAMTMQLRDLIGGLEQRVAARTAEVAQRSEELAHRSRQLEVLNQQLEVTSQHAERRAAQLAASAQVARAISQIRNLEQLLTQVTRLIGNAFDFYHVGIFIVDEAGRYAVLHAANSAGGQAMFARGHRLAVGQQGMVGYVTQTGLPRIALDAGADVVHFDNPDLPDTHSEMTLPLQVGGRILGALDLQTTRTAAFSDEDLSALSTLADQVALAIVNARLFEQTRQAVDELNTLNRRLMGEAWQSYVQTRAPDQVVWHSNDPALTPVPQAEADRLAAGEATATPHASVPITLRGQLIGALRFRAPADKWTDDARAIAASVASHLAQAIENTRLIEQTQRTAQREKQIAVAADSIHRATDLDNVLRAAIEEISRIAGVEDVGIQLGAAQPDQPGLFASLSRSQ